MSYTQRFSEGHAPLAKIDPVSLNGQTVTSFVSLRNYPRVVALVHVGAIAANRQIEARFEQATDTQGSGQKLIDGKDTDVLLTADQNGIYAIELRAEELDTNNGYDCVALKLTSQGGAVIAEAVVLGLEPRFAPVDQTLWAGVID